ncbi:MarR family transcriptional regulator [Rhodobacteraceae bacterium R_SAG10]|jgi:DNA-binding MarR family transcriptional regulator|nr:MarR family transcriptional regulator [Rhodobacteraceae bacterium R_SAG10]
MCGESLADFVLNDFLPYQLSVLSARISRDFSDLYGERFGISVSEWRIVAHLSQTSGPVSVREIYGRVNMDKSRVSRAAARLEARGFVSKTKSRADQRLVELSLTRAGRDMIRQMTPVALEFERDFLARLGTDNVVFRAALDTLLADDGHKS